VRRRGKPPGESGKVASKEFVNVPYELERRGLSVITHVSDVFLALTADAAKSRVEALAERAEGDEADAELLERRQDLLLGLSPPQRIFALEGSDRLNGMGAPDRLHACFGKAEVLDLAFLDQLLHRGGNVFDRHVRINAVLIEEIDAVGLQALERGLGDLPDVLRPAVKARLCVSGFEAELGGDHDLITEWGEGFADELLVGERTVSFRGIEEGDATLDGRLNKSDPLLLVGSRTVAKAQSHAAQPDGRDFQVTVSKLALLYCLLLSGTRHELERRGSRLGADDGVDDAGGVAAVLGAVGGVDLVVHVVRLDEENVFLDAAGPDPTFVAHLSGTEPGGRAPVDGPDVEVVAEADDPDRYPSDDRTQDVEPRTCEISRHKHRAQGARGVLGRDVQESEVWL
jgi:hypothetical protein